MILVLTGTSSWDFSRLIKEMDRIAGILKEEVVMQISQSDYHPINTCFFNTVSNEELDRLLSESRIVISHAGIGSIVSAIKHKKPLILVPRRKIFGEHFDDHQIDIAKEVEKKSSIKVIWDIEELESTITNKCPIQPAQCMENSLLISNLHQFLAEL